MCFFDYIWFLYRIFSFTHLNGVLIKLFLFLLKFIILFRFEKMLFALEITLNASEFIIFYGKIIDR